VTSLQGTSPASTISAKLVEYAELSVALAIVIVLTFVSSVTSSFTSKFLSSFAQVVTSCNTLSFGVYVYATVVSPVLAEVKTIFVFPSTTETTKSVNAQLSSVTMIEATSVPLPLRLARVYVVPLATVVPTTSAVTFTGVPATRVLSELKRRLNLSGSCVSSNVAEIVAERFANFLRLPLLSERISTTFVPSHVATAPRTAQRLTQEPQTSLTDKSAGY